MLHPEPKPQAKPSPAYPALQEHTVLSSGSPREHLPFVVACWWQTLHGVQISIEEESIL
jgi:hypothetical protein